jgi:hypothetical protein
MNLGRLKNYVLAEMLFAALMISVGCVLPLSILHSQALKHRSLLYVLEALAIGGLGLQLLIYITKASRRPLRLYLGIALLSTGVVLLIAV